MVFPHMDMSAIKKKCVHYSLFLLYLIVLIGVTETAMRIFFKGALEIIPADEKTLLYRYDETVGWLPVHNSFTVKARRLIHVEHNQRGFRDAEHVIGHHPRIVFLGDSFVWGFDVEKQERFTEKLRSKLANVSIYNLGISGYGTDQEFLLLTRQYDFYKPDIVFLVFCTDNDHEDNSHNFIRGGGYFKPYFITEGKHLTLQGVPVPKSWRYFIKQHDILSYSCWFRLMTKLYFKYLGPPRLEVKDPTFVIIKNMDQYVKDRGAQFIVGLQGDDPNLRQYLESSHIPFIDLSNPYIYPSHGRHWTPEGHTFVSEKIYHYLIRERHLEKKTAISRNIHSAVLRQR